MTPNEAPLILITTAGKIGAEASRLLAQRGVPVRVLVRNPEKVTALSQAGVDVCTGDLDVPATIDAAMRDVTSAVLVSPAVPRQELIADDNARAVGLMAGGDCDYVTSDVATILGRPPRTFEQFATDYAAAFSPTLVAR
jgi:NAD(P)-dependent dehydrogenase (short-subunit alcohol dehydrogenase family)